MKIKLRLKHVVGRKRFQKMGIFSRDKIMTECCSSKCEDKQNIAKQNCPVCGHKCLSVTEKTMLHHINKPWMYTLADQQYYYCSTENCDAIYFAENAEIITKSEIRTRIGIKEQSGDALICFCFGINKEEAISGKNVKEFVIQQTKASMCSCDTANPSGRCCLKDFPKF